MRLNPRTTTTALVAALALSAAPATAGASSSTSPAVLPNPDEQMLTSQARPLNRPLAPNRASASPCSEICSGGPAPSTASTGPGSEVIDNGGYGSPQTPATIVRVTTPRGFDWGDAGIGAAGAVGLALSALGVALAVSQRRARRSEEPTAVTS
jgi:hypothetical protein